MTSEHVLDVTQLQPGKIYVRRLRKELTTTGLFCWTICSKSRRDGPRGSSADFWLLLPPPQGEFLVISLEFLPVTSWARSGSKLVILELIEAEETARHGWISLWSDGDRFIQVNKQ